MFCASRQKAQKEAAKRNGKGSQLGDRAAGLKVCMYVYIVRNILI
jgi:hypothetical protein